MTAVRETVARPYSAGRSMWLVAMREVMVRLRSVAFLVSTGLMLALVLGSIIVSALVTANAAEPKVAVVEGVGDHGCEYMTGGTVVVLGPTGRNFAAGMSGGLAYVLDEDGSFERRVNPTMLNQLESPDERDRIELRGLIGEHLERTGSTVAARILEDWDEMSAKFVKVFPVDYKRVLSELEAERAKQMDEPQTIASAMEES